MNVFQYILIGWFALGTVLAIALHNNPPAKKTARGLAIGCLINVALIALVVLA